MSRARSRSGTPGGPRWLAWGLALALLLAQALGQWHHLAHGPAAAVAHASAAGPAGGDEAQLFGHASGDEAQCRLYDAVGTAAAFWTAPTLPALLPVTAEVDAPPPPLLASRPARPYEARAPPRG